MQNELKKYSEAAQKSLDEIKNLEALSEWHQLHLSRQGQLTEWKKKIGQLNPDDRKNFGQAVNQISEQLTQAFFTRQEFLKCQDLAARVVASTIDVTLPAVDRWQGAYHPVTLMIREITQVFQNMGFSVLESSHVETDEMAFQFLNIPPNHPARDMQDTFYVSDDVVLRPHTSPGQIHAMRRFAPHPVQVILPGCVYRYEDITPRSEVQFHQIEALLVGEDICFADLKGVLLRFAQAMFGADQAVRLRGSYFPFTEPSAEVDIKCMLCAGEGCRMCKHTGWLELLGTGLVHPAVLRHGGYDPEKVQGIALGLGVERVILLRHQIDDIRYLLQNDLRFLEQFS